MANLSGFRYQRIFTKIWTDDKFLSLKSDDSRYLFLYLLSSPHSNMIGLYKLPLKYIQADLNWELKRFTEPFAELLRERFIQYDEKVSLILICNHLKHNPLENPHQVTAACRIITGLPESLIILDILEPLGKPFHKPLVELLHKRLGKPVRSYPLEVIRKKEEEKEPFAEFDIFYSAYPKHEGKDAAKKAWAKLKPDAVLVSTMLSQITIAKTTEAWQKEKGKYIPLPATWLNGKRWEDEVCDPSMPQPPTGLIAIDDAITYMLQNIPGFHADMESWIDLWVDAGNTQSGKLGKKTYGDWVKFVSNFKEVNNV